jgi:hypothetical protein
MIETAIRQLLTHVPLVMFLLALVIAWFTSRRARSKADHYLRWLLLLAVGVDGLWAGLYHILAPETAASFIGWQVSPFQFEIGVADTALGITAVVSFWRSLDFRAAVVVFASLFYAGVVYGHIHDAAVAQNFAPGNVGIMLVISILRPLLLAWLLWQAVRDRKSQGIA